MSAKRLSGIAAVALLALGVSRIARASLVIALDLPTMVEHADHVAIVDVASVCAAWDPKHQRILTTIDLTVVRAGRHRWRDGAMRPMFLAPPRGDPLAFDKVATRSYLYACAPSA